MPVVENISYINHPGGTAFSFDDTEMHHWKGKGMVAQLDAESMYLAVHGPASPAFADAIPQSRMRPWNQGPTAVAAWWVAW